MSSGSQKQETNGEVWAIIPSRYGATRLPGKPLALIAGKPMVQHVYERVRAAKKIDRVVVATEDDRIAQVVTEFGGEFILTRDDHETGTDRIAEAVDKLTSIHGAPSWVMNVQGDEPVVDPADLDTLVSGLTSANDANMGTLVFPIEEASELDDPNIVKAVLTLDNRALYFSRASIPFPRGVGEFGWRHMGVYLFRGDFLKTFAGLALTPLAIRESLEQLRALENGFDIHCYPAQSLSIGVDVEEDIGKAEALLKKGA